MTNKKICSLVLVLISCLLILTGVPFTEMNVDAVTFSGKGTKSNPYLIENAQQVDEIRNNLKAHYKLNNTVDMSSISNFKPIGSIAKPFTGSFTCDTKSDGSPKYIIKNLKIVVSPKGATLAEKFSGYKDDGTSGWEAGLFGMAKGATFKNIVILNADVTSTVQGVSTMNSDWSLNPGQDDMGTGILAGIMQNSTVSYCGSSGKVTSAANNTGGLIGRDEGGSKITHSYSYADVTCTGVWNSGGFIGRVGEGGEVKYCFYEGSFKGGSTEDGAFFGVAYGNYQKSKNPGKVHDCWAGGTVLDESSGCFGGAQGLNNYATRVEPYTYVYNTYTIAVIKGRTRAQANKKVTNNNYITDQPGGLEIGYAAASQAEINEVFKKLSGWVVADGAYPQIKGLKPVKDATLYVPGAKVEDTSSATDSQTSENIQNSTNTEDEKEESKKEELTEESEDNKTLNADVKEKVSKMTSTEKTLMIVLIIIFAFSFAFFIYTVICILLYLRKQRISITELDGVDETENAE